MIFTRFTRFIGIVFLSFLFFFLSFFLANAASITATTSLPSQQTGMFGEKIFYYSTLKSNVTDFATHANDIDIIAPQTYEITSLLIASGTVPTDLYQAAQTDHVRIMPLITNHDFDQNIIHNFLASSTAENTMISFLVSEALAKGYTGWQFDFEHIPSSDRDTFNSFVEKAAASLHSQGFILSVAVVARAPGALSDDPSTSFYKNWSGAYDYTSLGSSTDFLSLMAYDDPDSKNASAPIPFIKNILQNILTQVPPSKISLGIPLFYWDWTTTNPPVRVNSGGAYQSAMNKIAKYPALQGFNTTIGAPWIIYKLNKKIYMIWYEDAQSFSLKAALIRSISSARIFRVGFGRRGSGNLENNWKVESNK